MRVFISHASDDKELAQELSSFLETELEGLVCWLSSTPASIPMGKPWFSKVLEELSKADIMIVLLTPQSANRMWVGFEAGMFWERMTRDGQKTAPPNLFVLTTGIDSIPSPLDQLQVGVLSDEEQLDAFITALSEEIGKPRTKRANLAVMAKVAQNLTNFHYRAILKAFPDPDVWLRRVDDVIYTWHCKLDDRIVLRTDNSAIRKISQPWLEEIPDEEENYLQTIEVFFKGQKIDSALFMSLDNDRYFVPYPREIPIIEESRNRNVWSKSTDEYLLFTLISRVDGDYSDLESLAKLLGFEIED